MSKQECDVIFVLNLFVTGQLMDFPSDNETEEESICADPAEGMSSYDITDSEDTNDNTQKGMFCIRVWIFGFINHFCVVYLFDRWNK